MSDNPEFILVLTTVSDDITASNISNVLVTEKLAACVSTGPEIKSCYSWKNKLDSSSEVPMLIKSRAELYPKLEKRLIELHPYEVPEIVSFKAENVYQDYLSWVVNNTIRG